MDMPAHDNCRLMLLDEFPYRCASDMVPIRQKIDLCVCRRGMWDKNCRSCGLNILPAGMSSQSDFFFRDFVRRVEGGGRRCRDAKDPDVIEHDAACVDPHSDFFECRVGFGSIHIPGDGEDRFPEALYAADRILSLFDCSVSGQVASQDDRTAIRFPLQNFLYAVNRPMNICESNDLHATSREIVLSIIRRNDAGRQAGRILAFASFLGYLRHTSNSQHTLMPTKKRTVHRSKRNIRFPWKPNKTALITGASNGIGYDISSVLAENGYNVVLVARSKEKLEALANQAREMFGVSARVIVKDLTQQQSADEIYRELERDGIEIDVLVNNAGYGLLGDFAFTSKDEELGMIQLNVLALAHLTKLFLPSMIRRGNGKILNISSVVGFQPGPLMANYSATKAYVVSFSTGLAEEVRENGVTVSVLCPGPTFTGFQERAGIQEKVLLKALFADSRVVARAGYEGLMAGRTIIIPGFFNKIGVFLSRVLPPLLIARFLKRYREPAMKPVVQAHP